MSDSGPNRREHLRVPIDKYLRVPIKAVRIAISTPRPSVGVDLSVGGLRFYCGILGVEVGDTLHVELELQGSLHMVVGTVVRVSEHDGSAQEIALAFRDVDPETQRLLTETLASEER